MLRREGKGILGEPSPAAHGLPGRATGSGRRPPSPGERCRGALMER